MDIEIAKYSGYCFGVKRALDIAEDTLKKNKIKKTKIYTLGQIIHNEGVVEDLEYRGLRVAESINEIEPGSTLIVRSHGMPPDVIESIKSKNVKIIDATCPFVKKAQVKIKILSKKGYFVIIIGNKKHPEVVGLQEYAVKNGFKVVENIKDLNEIGKKERIGVVIQTTQTMENVKSIISELPGIGKEILIENTICNTTEKRQNIVSELAKKVDVMIIIGGKNSSNTTHLREISGKYNINTYHIENYKELRNEWFQNCRKIGISGGASTPEKDIIEVKNFIENLQY